MTARASVVVVTWQGRHLLEPCLDALVAQTLRPDLFEVLVVDNASTDGTAELLAQRPEVRVITAARNLGFAGGATLGLETVSTPYAAVLNNDAVPDPDWLEQLLAGFAPGVAAVTSKVVLAPRYALLQVPSRPQDVRRVLVDGVVVTVIVVGLSTPSGVELAVPAGEGRDVEVVVEGTAGALHRGTVPASAPRFDILNSTGGLLTPTGHGADRGYLEVDRGQYDTELDVFAVCGAAAAFRTDVAGPAGWFDPWFFAYYEDLDLSWRLRRAGWQLRFVSEARVRHEHAATSRVGSDLFVFHNRRNRLAALARNASLRELAGFAAATVRARPAAELQLLAGSPDGQQTAAPGTSRVTAVLSFLSRLPVLLASRARRRTPRP